MNNDNQNPKDKLIILQSVRPVVEGWFVWFATGSTPTQEEIIKAAIHQMGLPEKMATELAAKGEITVLYPEGDPTDIAEEGSDV